MIIGRLEKNTIGTEQSNKTRIDLEANLHIYVQLIFQFDFQDLGRDKVSWFVMMFNPQRTESFYIF